MNASIILSWNGILSTKGPLLSAIKQFYEIKKSSEMRDGIQDLEKRSYSERIADRMAIAGFGERRIRLPSFLKAAIAISLFFS